MILTGRAIGWETVKGLMYTNYAVMCIYSMEYIVLDKVCVTIVRGTIRICVELVPHRLNWFQKCNVHKLSNTPVKNHHFEYCWPWLQADLGDILPVHGIATQGHSSRAAWVTAYKVAISIDTVNFVTLKQADSDEDLVRWHDINTL